MIEMEWENLEHYLKESLGDSVHLKDIGEIGLLKEQGMKDFGYGKAIQLTYEQDGCEQQAVLSVMRGDRYGHQFYWDRAAILMFEFATSANLENHVKPLGIGYIDEDGRLVPVKRPREFFILNEKVTGSHYFQDLERIKNDGLQNSDIERACEFARWLAKMHSHKKHDGWLRCILTRSKILIYIYAVFASSLGTLNVSGALSMPIHIHMNTFHQRDFRN